MRFISFIHSLHVVIACILGVGIYWLAAPLGWIGALIAVLSMMVTVGIADRLSSAGVRTLFLICVLFHIAGFTVIAYPSAQDAYNRYGDFHSGITDANYGNILLQPWHAAPVLRLFFAEGKIVKGVINFIRPPAGESESIDAAVEAIIAIGIVSRIVAFVLFYFFVQSAGLRARAVAAALLIFTFQYTNIALTQSMKFVAGLPFFMFWLVSFSEYERTGHRRWLAAHVMALPLLLISEQWIIFFVAALYLLYPFFRRGAGIPLRVFDVFGTALVAFASTTLYFLEWGRITSNHIPLLPLVPSAFRSAYLHEYPALLLIFSIACGIGLCIYKKTFGFSGKKFLSLGIVPYAIFMQSLIFLNPAMFLQKNFLLFFLPYWLLVSCSLGMIIRNAFVVRKIDAVAVLALVAWTIGSLPQIFLMLGASMPTSPVLDVIILPLLVGVASRDAHKAFLLFFTLVVLVGFLSVYKLLVYTDGWARAGVLLPVILVPIAIAITRKYRYA